jgi:hypothetical protein
VKQGLLTNQTPTCLSVCPCNANIVFLDQCQQLLAMLALTVMAKAQQTGN